MSNRPDVNVPMTAECFDRWQKSPKVIADLKRKLAAALACLKAKDEALGLVLKNSYWDLGADVYTKAEKALALRPETEKT